MNNISRPQQTQLMSQSVEGYVHETQRLTEMSSDIVACLFTSARQAAPPATTEGS
jgi:hypothetical protein